MEQIYDMIVIGGGPAGYTAALYAARSGLSVVVLEKLSAGGQMALTEQIDNRLEAAADEVPADADDMENISGAFRVRLSNKVKKRQMVSLGEGSRKLTWGFVDANSVKRQILKETEEQQPDSAGAL